MEIEIKRIREGKINWIKIKIQTKIYMLIIRKRHWKT